MLVGATYEDTGGSDAGAAYLLLGSRSGLSDGSVSGADAKLTGEGMDHLATGATGTGLASAGDVNGDGYSDVLIGASGEDTNGTGAGAAYLLLGSSSGLSDMSLASADAKLTAESAGDRAGHSVSTAGDVNSDGYADLLVGAIAADTTGAVYLILGSSGAVSDMSLASADAKVTGEVADDSAGFSVSTAGDVNDDGYSDWLLGAQGNDAGGSWSGAAYVIEGGSL